MRSLTSNPKWLFFGRALTETKTLNAVVTLFYLARGVSFSQVFILSLVFSIASLACEIPTGYLADRFGRKNTLLLGVFFLVLFNIGVLFAHGFEQFAILFGILAASVSCFSGTEEAMLYDSLKATHNEKKMSVYNGQLHAARSVMKNFLPAIGALIAWNLAEWQFTIIIGIDILASLGAIYCFWQLIEPPHRRQVLKEEAGIFRHSLITIRKHPFLFRASMNKTLIFIGGIIMWRVYQPIVFEAGAGAIGLALCYFMMHGILFITRFYSGALEKRFGTVALLIVTALAIVGNLIIFMLTENVIILAVTIITAIIAQASRDPLFAHAMNARISSHSRATTLSNLSAIKGVLEIPILLACSAVAVHDPKYPVLIVMLITIIAIVCFPIRTKDLA